MVFRECTIYIYYKILTPISWDITPVSVVNWPLTIWTAPLSGSNGRTFGTPMAAWSYELTSPTAWEMTFVTRVWPMVNILIFIPYIEILAKPMIDEHRLVQQCIFLTLTPKWRHQPIFTHYVWIPLWDGWPDHTPSIHINPIFWPSHLCYCIRNHQKGPVERFQGL